MPQHERVSWVSLIVTALISLWYFELVLSMPGDSHLMGPGMALFVVVLIVIAITAAILSELVLRWLQRRGGGDPKRRERLDERDRLSNLRAGRNAYVVPFGGIALVLGLIYMIPWMRLLLGSAAPAHGDTVRMRMICGPLDAPLIAQWLLPALTLADLCKYLTRIVCYRRGY